MTKTEALKESLKRDFEEVVSKKEQEEAQKKVEFIIQKRLEDQARYLSAIGISLDDIQIETLTALIEEDVKKFSAPAKKTNPLSALKA